MFCKNCGTQLPDEARFCNNCGAQVNNTPAPPVEAEPKQEPVAPTPQPVPVVEQIPPVQEIIDPTPVPEKPEPVAIMPDPISEPESPAAAPVTPGSVPVTEPPIAEASQASFAKKKTSWKVWLGIIIALVVLVGGISKCSDSKKGTNEDYVSCAIQLTRNNLKSPSSAVFYNCVVEEIDDYGRILVSLEFEAQNSFGAMIRNYAIVVLQDYDDGTFTYNPNFAVQFYKNTYEKSSTIELTKSLNKWNEPKTED